MLSRGDGQPVSAGLAGQTDLYHDTSRTGRSAIVVFLLILNVLEAEVVIVNVLDTIIRAVAVHILLYRVLWMM